MISVKSALLFRAANRTCALDVSHVLEVMRPLPVQPIGNTPDFVRGLAEIRGEATPVVSLQRLLGSGGGIPARFVVVRDGAERRLALAVDEVLGLAALDPVAFHALPALAQDAAGVLEAVGPSADQLLFVLNAGKIVPEEVWLQLIPHCHDPNT